VNRAERPAGIPTVDTMARSSPCPRFCRISSSTRATTFSVSSTRVPIGARRKTRNWLSSELGKNSVPISGTSARLAAKTRRTPTTTSFRGPSARWSTSWYPASSRSKNAWLTRMKRSRQRRLAASAGRAGRSSRRHMSGVTVRETRKDANSENEIVKVNGMKSSFDWPSRKTVGRNTTIVVIVETKIGIATSRAASSTAVRRSVSGMARCRLMFSSSTMESSTRRPTASASPPSVKMFSVCPRKYIAISVHRIDSGIAVKMMPVETKLRRKTRMTSNASTAP
jgi:hypothetical protein